MKGTKSFGPGATAIASGSGIASLAANATGERYTPPNTTRKSKAIDSGKPQAEILALLGELPKGRTGEIVRIAVKTFNGSPPYLDIRQYATGNGEPVATRKGVTMPVESIAVLEAACAAYRAANLSDER